jgi:hypothetical protein
MTREELQERLGHPVSDSQWAIWNGTSNMPAEIADKLKRRWLATVKPKRKPCGCKKSKLP